MSDLRWARAESPHRHLLRLVRATVADPSWDNVCVLMDELEERGIAFRSRSRRWLFRALMRRRGPVRRDWQRDHRWTDLVASERHVNYSEMMILRDEGLLPVQRPLAPRGKRA